MGIEPVAVVHSRAIYRAVNGNTMIPALLPELLTCTPTMETDHNIMMNQSVTDIDRVKVIMSTIQKLTLNVFTRPKFHLLCVMHEGISLRSVMKVQSSNLTSVPLQPENLSDIHVL